MLNTMRLIATVLQGLPSRFVRYTHYLVRCGDGRYRFLTSWRPRKGMRNVGRPMARYVDDITYLVGKTWTRLAEDRKDWRKKLMLCIGLKTGVHDDDNDKL